MDFQPYFKQQLGFYGKWDAAHPKLTPPSRNKVFYLAEDKKTDQLRVFECFYDEVNEVLEGFTLFSDRHATPRFTRTTKKQRKRT